MGANDQSPQRPPLKKEHQRKFDKLAEAGGLAGAVRKKGWSVSFVRIIYLIYSFD